MYYLDSYYLILILPAMLIALFAQANVTSSFKKYSKHKNVRGLTASDVARRILDANGLRGINIERVAGSLSDHYDPKDKVVRLSDTVYNSTDVASIGVAAHEVGHAIQHATKYFPLNLRNSIYPVVNIASQAAVPLIILGFIIDFINLSYIGILLFSAVVFFQLITLPVEFNASRRALKILDEYDILSKDELKPARKVLSAAALTYVASALVAIMQLLRFVLQARRRD
ncbi:MAG: zinc metallopeptidase [Ruminococcaceae bacterium]|nr:zinc metallopeptidase [Oscillospiraceae bacterium]